MNYAIIELLDGEKLVRSHTLEDNKMAAVGSDPLFADIAIEDERLSPAHFYLSFSSRLLSLQTSGEVSVHLEREGANGVRSEVKSAGLSQGDRVWVHPDLPYSVKVREIKAEHAGAQETRPLRELLAGKDEIRIGRKGIKGNDLTFDDRTVSRQHARVFKKGGAFYVEDYAGSTNGVFLNGRRLPVGEPTRFGEDDTIYICLYALTLDVTRDLNKELAIQAVGVTKVYDKAKGPALHEMTVEIQPKEFVALMGPSGCGKSTLLKLLNNSNPATDGAVYINGLKLDQNYDFLKRKIGYVPQDDIVHSDLTVDQTLFYAAKLRMGDKVSPEVIHRKIEEVLSSLKINDPMLRPKKVSALSGGQRKRVCIAVELLNSPSILFLDEPTSPLDPETIEEFLKCINALKDKGTTIVMVTHKPEDLNYVDKVIFLTTKGRLAFFGDKKGYLPYFAERAPKLPPFTDKDGKFVKESKAEDVIDVYGQLSRNEHVDFWGQEWLDLPKQKAAVPKEAKKGKPSSESSLKQFFWLTTRYLNIKLADRGNLMLLLLQPLVIAGLLAFIYEELQLGVLFLTAIASIWFGVSNAAKEIVGEQPVYRRERMFNLKIMTYLCSKITVLSLIAVVQVAVFLLILFARYSWLSADAIHLVNFGSYFGVMLYMAVSATLLGLFLSAFFSTTDKVLTVVPIVLIPQIMLAGVLTRIDSPFKEYPSFLMLSRWGTEGFAHIQDDESFMTAPTIRTRYTESGVLGTPLDKFSSKSAGDTVVWWNETVVDSAAKFAEVLSVYYSLADTAGAGTVEREKKLENGQWAPLKTTQQPIGRSGAVDLIGLYEYDGLVKALLPEAGESGGEGGFSKPGVWSCLAAMTLLNAFVFGLLIWAMRAKD